MTTTETQSIQAIHRNAVGAPDDIASITDTGGPPDKETLTVGEVTGQQNDPVSIPAQTIHAVRFRVTVD